METKGLLGASLDLEENYRMSSAKRSCTSLTRIAALIARGSKEKLRLATRQRSPSIPAHDPVNLISLGQQLLSQIRSIPSCNARE